MFVNAVLGLVSSTASTIPSVDFSNTGIADIATAIASNVPTILAAIVPILGIRKVISFAMGAIRGA